MKIRLIMLGGLLSLGIALGIVLYLNRVQPPVAPTFTSAFQIFGETVRVVDRLAGRLMPIDDFDEAALGQALKGHFLRSENAADAYVNEILQTVSARKNKDFAYEAHVIPWHVPNAMALPGGVIFVTEGLLATLDNEAQLAAVLAHEVGHIELSHCVDKVKYEITARKLGVLRLGEIADMTVRLMLNDAFSKTQEHEADVYAWTWLRHSRYDPRGVGDSFAALRRWHEEESVFGSGYRPGLLRDYFASHPPLEVRQQEFSNRADRWWSRHAGERRYAGRENLTEMSALSDRPGLADEWVTGS
jgi:predicted Zn-dependent protease